MINKTESFSLISQSLVGDSYAETKKLNTAVITVIREITAKWDRDYGETNQFKA